MNKLCLFALAFYIAMLVVLGLGLVGCGGGDPPPELEKDRYVRPKAQ